MGKDRLVLVLNNSGQWEDKTGDVARCITDSASGQVKISYKRNPKHEYSYRQERVRLLDATAALDPTVVRLRVGGRLLPNVDSITQYPDYYLVTATGYRKLYAASKVSVEQDAAATPACRNALEYFRAVAELVSLKNEDGQPILAGQYKYLSRLPDTSVLATYLTPGSALAKHVTPGSLIYPFGTNASQKTAVEMAFLSQVTIVQGPPGTGKTQTILNIIANAIRFGQTVAMVSNNNAATQNVADKLEKKGWAFCWLR